jgi:hypothetical protein
MHWYGQPSLRYNDQPSSMKRPIEEPIGYVGALCQRGLPLSTPSDVF